MAYLSLKRTRAIVALLSTPNLVAASEASGVTERTLRRWMKREDFRAALAEAEAEALDAATRRLTGIQGKALEVIEKALEAESLSLRLRAAQLAMEYLLKLRVLRSVEERLERLEGVLDAE